MRIVDAHTGRDVKVGDRIPDGDGGAWELLRVRDVGFFDVRALVRLANGTEQWVKLQVRVLHPSYLLQWVAFVPT